MKSKGTEADYIHPSIQHWKVILSADGNLPTQDKWSHKAEENVTENKS